MCCAIRRKLEKPLADGLVTCSGVFLADGLNSSKNHVPIMKKKKKVILLSEKNVDRE